MPPRKLKRKQIVLTAPGSKSPVSMWFVNIPACPDGFLMGSRGYDADEEPIHRVAIDEDFWLAETLVTQEQFDVWPGAAERGEDHWPAGKANHPANNLSWHDAMQYCDWLTRTHGKKFPKGFPFAELPCEARWDYACRAEKNTEYSSGDGVTALDVAGWYDGNSANTTQPVKSKKFPNDFQLSDMHGNVWEWCLDRWDAAAYRRRWDGITDVDTYRLSEEFGDRELFGFPDPRVLRGGSWTSSAYGCRSACRVGDWAGVRFLLFGFRVCLVRSPLFSQTGEAEPERTALERRDEATGAGSDGEAEILKTSSPGSARGRTAPEAPPPQPCPVP